jgi:uncharacterized protein (TIGR02266 family)
VDRVRIVFPVRFSTDHTAVQTTSREVSAEGVFVRCLQSPNVGAQVALKLYLPGGFGLEARAIVRQIELGEDGGFWADFAALAGEQRDALKQVVERQKRIAEATPIGALPIRGHETRRSFPRVNARFAVRFASVQDFVLEYAANISAGGVFVQTQNPPPLKSIVRVEMELPGGAAVPAQGLVVHRVTPEEAKARGTAPGCGVQFIAADDAFRQRIDAAIDEILKAQKAAAG